MSDGHLLAFLTPGVSGAWDGLCDNYGLPWGSVNWVYLPDSSGTQEAMKDR